MSSNPITQFANVSFTVRPTHYFPANVASIRSITFVQTPPLSRTLDGSLNLDGEPSLVVTAGFDGTVSMVDLSESVVPMTLYHDRGTDCPPIFPVCARP